MAAPDNFVYPEYLQSQSYAANFIRFTANKYQYGGHGDKIGSVSFYHPGNIAFADGASYATFDMGPIGRELANAVSGIASAADGDNAVENTRNQVLEAIKPLTASGNSDLRSVFTAKVLGSVGSMAGVPGAENIAAINANVRGLAVNPNTTAAFSNMNIRTYAFTFKLIAEKQSDSVLIRDIQNFIRNNMYAEASSTGESGSGGYLLGYPATFSISFHTANGLENPYYPKIYECFLTNFSSNFNASSHLHHEGGAPVEVDITLTFQETKVLTRQDLASLSSYTGGDTYNEEANND